MKDVMPVITLYQPWASWVVRGYKKIETRTHNKFKSLEDEQILIHAGIKTDTEQIFNPYISQDLLSYDPDGIVNGAIVGSVFVYNFGKLNDSHSQDALIDCGSVERYGLFLENPFEFDKPIFIKGSMGIWYYDMWNNKKATRSEFTPMRTL